MVDGADNVTVSQVTARNNKARPNQPAHIAEGVTLPRPQETKETSEQVPGHGPGF